LGALALLIPRSAAAGGVWLGVTMAFAVLTHLPVVCTENPIRAC
jgi:hypothetical protein